MCCLFEGAAYSRAERIRGWHLFEGGTYSRTAVIRANTVLQLLIHSVIFHNDVEYKADMRYLSC